MKKIAILGSTGSIGESTLKVAAHLKNSIQVTALAAHSNVERMEAQILAFQPEIVAMFDEKSAKQLRAKNLPVEVLSGAEGVAQVAAYSEVDYVVMAIVGMDAIAPTIAAIQAKKSIGLANKEILVSAGEYITRLAKQHDVQIIPIDSEHSAIFQCLQKVKREEVRRIVLTASGGPFRSYSKAQLGEITLAKALKHPTWAMGAKITIDSSTLMNKGLEMIETRWLFDIADTQIDIIVHPQSIIHSFVECIDGSMFAQMSEPDMVFPIQYALTYPERKEGIYPPFDFLKNGHLDFYAPDFEKFPTLTLAYEAIREGGSTPCFLNAANEVLVGRFLKEEISWIGIIQKLEKLMSQQKVVPVDCIESILSVDTEARQLAKEA